MLKKLILVEGKNDLIFINWLIGKFELLLPASVKIIQVGGKSKFISYIYKVVDSIEDKENKINYEEEQIKNILLIKDFDYDDRNDEFNLEIIDIKQSNDIVVDKYYISGCDNPPKILETLLIYNDGELLKNFHTYIHNFNSEQPEKLMKLNDKNIFEAYLKLNLGTIKYTDEILNNMFESDGFSNLPDIKNLVNRIKRFIEE